ncbi:hypothetical protein Indivirus_1_153 [Indivirus ILV1]|uniref:Uncharacterized protein n=1 Tax=Indivirus ILV1 TaxID=1977633 RepID=A0A1V0SCT1_9VIRU|nr:hypothetical protein Indivirus_1_153 [Indivirus ILV1]
MSTEKKPNKTTEKAGLTFNVNTIKQKLKSYYEGQDLLTLMFSGGHIAITATLEKLWETILHECLKRVGKDKSGVRQVNRESLQYSVLMHSGLERYFMSHFRYYDVSLEYKDQSPVINTELDKVMERVDKDMSLTSKARNLAHYMLLKVFSHLAVTAHGFVEYAKKKSLDGRSVTFAVSTVFHESVSSDFNKEITRVMKEFGEELEETHAANETPSDTQGTTPAGEADTGDGEEEKQSAKTKNTKKTTSTTSTTSSSTTSTKNAKKKTETIEEEADDKEEQEEQEEQDEKEDNDEKPEEAAPSKSTKKAVTGSTTKKSSNSPKQTKNGKK